MTLLGHRGGTAVFKNRYPSGLPAPVPVGFVVGFSWLGTVEGRHLGRRKEDLGTTGLKQNSCPHEREGRWPKGENKHESLYSLMRKKKGGGGDIANPKTATGFAECFQELCCVSAQSKADSSHCKTKQAAAQVTSVDVWGGDSSSRPGKEKKKKHNEP